MTLTKQRTIQYIGVLIALFLIAVGYWYFSARAGSTITDRAITYNALTSGSATSTDPATTASITPGANRLILAAVTSNSLQSPTLTGNGLTWVEIGAIQDAARRTALFRAMGSAPTAGAVTIDWASAPGEQRWVISEFDNVDTSGTNGSGAVVQSATNFVDLTTTFTVTLGAFSSPGNATYGVVQAYTVDSNSVSPGSGFTGIVNHGTNFKQVAEYKIGNDTTVDWSNINNVYWRGIAVEIKKKGSTKLNTSIRDSLYEGLVGYWKLDDASGTTATDSSTNANNGTLTNGPTWGTGQIGGAVTFDGTNDYITAPHSTALNFNYNENFSIALWVKIPATQNNTTVGSNVIFQKWLNVGPYPYVIRLLNQTYGTVGDRGKIYGARYDGTNNPLVMSTAALNDNVWHNINFVKRGATLEFYVDGVLNSTATDTTNTTTTNSYGLYAGSEAGTQYYLTGSVDDVRIYNRSLIGEEITKLYRTTVPTNPDTRLKGYWSFDGDAISGTTALDLSGAGNNGTLTNGPTKTIGVRGQALNFDGTTGSQYVNVGSAANLDDLGPFTISTWIYPRSTGLNSFGTVASKANSYGANGSGWILEYISGKMSFDVDYATTDLFRSVPASAVAMNTWQHLVVTWDGSTNASNVHIYINGVESAYDTTTNASGSRVTDATPSLLFGNSAQTFTTWDGKIDEVRIYNAALSASEIYNLYQEGGVKVNKSQSNNGDSLNDGLAGYWKLDDASGTTATDSSGNGNNGTLTNGPTWGTGQIGGATTFDGNNDFIALSDSTTLHMDQGKSMTFTAWVNLSTLGVMHNILRYDDNDNIDGDNSSTRNLYLFRVSNTNYLHATYGPSTGLSQILSATPLTSGSWYHVVFVRNVATDTENLYVNGVLSASETDTTSGSWETTGQYPLVGRHFDGGTAEYLNGSLDEVRIYNRALSADEVSKLYKTTSPTNPETGLVGYWSFNGADMSGTTAYDRSGKGNNGTLTNGPTLTIGKVGQAVNFDGSNDYIDAGSPASLDDLTTRTISAWINPASYGLASESWMVRIADKSNGSATAGWNIWLCSVSMCGGGNQIWIRQGFSVSAGGWNSGANPVTLGAWTHVAMTYDSSLTTNDPILYINGAAVSLTENSTPIGTPGSDAAINFTIGNQTSTVATFDGKIDDMRVYNRILTPAEITSLYNFGR